MCAITLAPGQAGATVKKIVGVTSRGEKGKWSCATNSAYIEYGSPGFTVIGLRQRVAHIDELVVEVQVDMTLGGCDVAGRHGGDLPPVIDTLTTSAVPWTTSPLVGKSRVIFTGVDGRWPKPAHRSWVWRRSRRPEGPSAVAELHAVRTTSSEVRRTGEDVALFVPCPAHYAQRHPKRIQQRDGFNGCRAAGAGGTQRIWQRLSERDNWIARTRERTS